MFLKYDKHIHQNTVYIDLETKSFTAREERALKKFGEPVVLFEKVYGTDFGVSIERRIKTGFKVRVKFDGATDFDGAVTAANTFFDDIQLELTSIMEQLMLKLSEAEMDFESGSGMIEIKGE